MVLLEVRLLWGSDGYVDGQKYAAVHPRAHTGVDEKRFIHTHLTLRTVCPSARGSVNSLVVMRLVVIPVRVY